MSVTAVASDFAVLTEGSHGQTARKRVSHCVPTPFTKPGWWARVGPAGLTLCTLRLRGDSYQTGLWVPLHSLQEQSCRTDSIPGSGAREAEPFSGVGVHSLKTSAAQHLMFLLLTNPPSEGQFPPYT